MKLYHMKVGNNGEITKRCIASPTSNEEIISVINDYIKVFNISKRKFTCSSEEAGKVKFDIGNKHNYFEFVI